MKSHSSTSNIKKKLSAPKATSINLASTLESIGHIWVSDIMQRNPVTVNLNENLDEATGILAENSFRHLPVIDKEGDIQGILSDRDLLNAVLRTSRTKLYDRADNPWTTVQVKSVMTKTPETVTPETTLAEAGALILENRISCLPVVEGNHLVGIITSSDFVKLVSQGMGAE